MPLPNKRFFAVGLKGWVQIRVATKPPKAVTSSTVVDVQERKVEWIPGYMKDNHWIASKPKVTFVPRQMTLKDTIYEGGKTIKTMKSTRFAALLKVGVREGGMTELMPEQVERLREVEKW